MPLFTPSLSPLADEHEPYSYLVLLHEAGEGGSLDLDWLADPVVQRDHEVEEVALPQVGRRLLLEVHSTEPNAAAKHSELRHNRRVVDETLMLLSSHLMVILCVYVSNFYVSN